MNRDHVSTSRILTGGTFIAVGILVLLGSLTFDTIFSLIDFWPLILVAIGLARLTEPGRWWSGARLVAIGAWLQLITLGLFGLDWDNGWPMLLVFVGLGMVGAALAGEDRDRCRRALGGHHGSH